MTYELSTVAGRAAIRCLLCDRISELPGDVENHYCSRCHLFHDVVAEARAYLADGASHECAEWQTCRGVCAVCGAGGQPMDDVDIVTRMAVECANRQPFHLVVNATAAVQIAGLMQLALRHPNLDGHNKRTAIMVVEQIRAYFTDTFPPAPATLEAMRQGDNPDNDRPWPR